MQHRLAIVTTHPIQYNAPLFGLLAQQEDICLKVFYTWGEASLNKFDPGFNKTIEWNIPLLEGYDHCFVNNVAKKPGSHHFRGIDNPTLVQDINAWNPDVILVYGWAFKSHLQVMRYFHGKRPVFFRGDSTSLNRKIGLKAIVRKAFLRWVYRHVDVALYAGTHNKTYFAEHGLKETQLLFMPHAVDNGRFQLQAGISEETLIAWKESTGIPADKTVFLFAGKLDKNKNAVLLIDAFLDAGLANAHLVIAGNGPEEGWLKKEYGRTKNITFLPFQNQAEMPILYAASTIFVLPSKSETWGLAINEAMACGKPVLAASGCGAAVDLVRPGVNGLVFRNDDKKDLVEKLTLMAQNKHALQEMGRGAVGLIQGWSFEKDCEVIQKQLQKINSRELKKCEHAAAE